MYSFSLLSSVLPLFTISSLLFSQVEATTEATCYFPDTSIATNYVACSSTQNGGCCLDSDICTEWGYCVSQSKGYHYRGACTDSTWENPSCPDYCLGSSTGNSSIVNVIACNAADSDGTWCCAYDGNCCSGTSTFVPGFGTMFAEPGGSLTTSAAASAATSVSASTTSGSSTTSQTSQTPTTASTSSLSTTAIPNAATTSSSTPTIVGAAVGIPLGLAFIAALYLLYRERQKHKNPQSGNFGMNKLDDNSTFTHGSNSLAAPNSTGGGYYAPNAPITTVEPIMRYGEIQTQAPHYELGPGGKPYELGDR